MEKDVGTPPKLLKRGREEEDSSDRLTKKIKVVNIIAPVRRKAARSAQQPAGRFYSKRGPTHIKRDVILTPTVEMCAPHTVELPARRVELASEKVAIVSAEKAELTEDAVHKLEVLDSTEKVLPIQVPEPRVGPKCFAVPISHYLLMVERDQEVLAWQMREQERGIEALEMQVKSLRQEKDALIERVRELEKREGEDGYHRSWLEKRHGKQKENGQEDNQEMGIASPIQQAEELDTTALTVATEFDSDAIAEVKSVLDSSSESPREMKEENRGQGAGPGMVCSATRDECDCAMCRRGQLKTGLTSDAGPRVSCSKVVPIPLLENSSWSYIEEPEMVEAATTVVQVTRGPELGVTTGDVNGTDVITNYPTYDTQKPNVWVPASMLTGSINMDAQLGVSILSSSATVSSFQTQLITSTGSGSDPSLSIDVSQNSDPTSSLIYRSYDREIKPLPTARVKQNRPTLSSSISSINDDSDSANPALVELVERGLPPGFLLAFNIPEGAQQSPNKSKSNALDDKTDEETEALARQLNKQWEIIIERKEELRKKREQRAKAKARAREDRWRRR